VVVDTLPETSEKLDNQMGSGQGTRRQAIARTLSHWASLLTPEPIEDFGFREVAGH
jgi:hypothetical protein